MTQKLTSVTKDENLIKTLKESGVVIMPTDTLYGVLGRAEDKWVVERIYGIRKRNPEKPCIVLISDLNELPKFGVIATEAQMNAIANFQEPTSFIVDCPDEKFSHLHRGAKTLAFRIPRDETLIGLLMKTGPLIAPSANLEGEEPAKNIEEAKKYFGDSVDLYIDGGELKGKLSKLIKLHPDGTASIIRG